MARTLNYRPEQDIKADNLFDVLVDNSIKIYPYLLPNVGKAKYFIGDAVTALLSMTQDGLNGLNEDGSIDIIIDVADGVNLEAGEGAEYIGKKLFGTNSLTIQSQTWVKHSLDDVKMGKTRFNPIAFTVGVPFDSALYANKEQELFIVSSVTPIRENYFSERTIDKEGMYNIDGVSLHAIESQYKYCEIIPVIGYISTKITSDDDFVIGMENTSLLGKISCKGEILEREMDISFSTSANLLPFKGSIIDTNGKVTLSADWFDYDMTLPWFIAKLFKTPQNLSVLKNIPGTTFTDVEIQCIIDMMAIATGYGNTWKDIDRAKGNESNWDGAKQQIGKLLPDTTIGSVKFAIPTLEGQDPIKSIDGVYETYLRTNVGKEGSFEAQVIKQILCAISRYIYSSYAIGKGQNSFNEIYLPWTLRPTDALSLKPGSPYGNGYSEERNYQLDINTRFQLQSRYFNFSTDELKNIYDIINISDVRLLQSDRKLTLPTIPLQLQSQNKLPLPGDISTNSSQDLQYNWYVPRINNNNNDIFMYGDALKISDNTVKITKTFINYLTSINPNPENPLSKQTDEQRRNYIINDVLNKYGSLKINKNDIVFDLSTITYPTQQLKIPQIFNIKSELSDSFLRFTFTGTKTNRNFVKTFTTADTSINYKLTNDELIKLFSLNYQNDNSNFNTGGWVITLKGAFGFNVQNKSSISITGETTFNSNTNNKTFNQNVTLDTQINNESIQLPSLIINNFPEPFFDNSSLYTKDTFEEKILTIFGHEFVPINIVEIKGREITKLHFIEITSLYSNDIVLRIKNQSFNIKSKNIDDETLSQTTITFC